MVEVPLETGLCNPLIAFMFHSLVILAVASILSVRNEASSTRRDDGKRIRNLICSFSMIQLQYNGIDQ